jgi:hypothetical protein
MMIRAAITSLPSRNALRRSYLKLLLFLLRPTVSFLSSLVVGRVFSRPRLLACRVEYGGKRISCKQDRPPF